MYQLGAHGRAIEWVYPRPHMSPFASNNQGVEKLPVQISAKWLEINGNVDRSHLRPK